MKFPITVNIHGLPCGVNGDSLEELAIDLARGYLTAKRFNYSPEQITTHKAEIDAFNELVTALKFRPVIPKENMEEFSNLLFEVDEIFKKRGGK